MITRREILIALGAGALAAPLASFAQQRGKVWRVGYVGQPVGEFHDAFVRGLQDIGWTVGGNVLIDYRPIERTAELVSSKVDVIFANGTRNALAAKNATTDIPIIFANVSDPVASGLVATLSRPGGNATGLSNNMPELGSKILQLIRDVKPRASRIAVLRDPQNPGKLIEFSQLEVLARQFGITAYPCDAAVSSELDKAFANIVRLRPDALVTLSDGVVTFPNRERIVAFAAKQRLLAIYQVREFVEAGGLMSYGFKVLDMYRYAASHVNKILKGAKPADIPVELPTIFELVVNMKTAKALGIKIPNSILVRADKVIE
jgi:putative ABC transport system substrate-binding protein